MTQDEALKLLNMATSIDRGELTSLATVAKRLREMASAAKEEPKTVRPSPEERAGRF